MIRCEIDNNIDHDSDHLPIATRGWDEQCAAILAETKRFRRDHSERQTEESWEAYRTARNKKGRIIKKALQQAHREAVETAAESPRSLWKIAKWARNRQSQPPTVTPEIRNPNTSQVAATPEEKAALFKETFFLPPPEANLEDIDNASYSNQIGLPPVSESEVEDAIQEAAPLKAPGPDGITNLALQVARPWITPHLVRIFNQSLRLGYCPQHFRKLDTGIPEGSPLSPILYLFYNADLLDSCNETGDTTATGFIDDVAILAVGDSTEETCQKLQEALRKAETWALTHASVFAPEKFQLTHFTRFSRPSQKRHKPSENRDSKSSSDGYLPTSSHHTWQTKWETETRGRTSFRLTPKPTKKVLGLHEGLSKRQSALLVQMRTEKIGLQDFLFNRRVPGITNANCPCREGRQTVSHILLRCRRFRQLRRQEFGTLPGRHNLRVILNKRKAAAKAIRFIEQTEILGQHGIESHTRLS
ncbi:zinc knuckle [Colletotrichum limetticola]|uniref:Zinc knuckle n=1 Tax=Colletotrichum limetticola TaxID=1209924 RepID=A0ABQ9P761_9PEZI|nr:zinc knuckle [Colletotrichum limetticola]